MTKERKLILVPALIVAGLLIYCWISIFTNNIIPEWQHYVGLVLFIPLVYLFFKNVTMCVIALGLYLLIATFNGLAMTAVIITSWMRIGPVETPPVQMLSLGVLVLYFILNIKTLIETYLDYEEKKKDRVS
jgi:hypothetical protein